MGIKESLIGLVLGSAVAFGINEKVRGASTTYEGINEVQTQSQNLVYNGEFTNNANGWALIGHGNPSDSDWQPGPGWNGEAGYFFVNHAGSHIGSNAPETSQLITGLIPGEPYNISGYFKRQTENHPDPNFQVLLENNVYFTAGGRVEDGWINFHFDYLAGQENALLRFQSQVTGDDAYYIDGIRMELIPSPSSLALLGAGALAYSARRKRED